MYNINSALSVEKNTNNYLDAGIQENVKITEVRTDVSVNGNPFIEFTFKKMNGGSATHTEWEPKRFDQDTNDSFNLKCAKQYARILQILGCFYSEEYLKSLDFNPATFAELAKWTKEMLERADLSKLLRVKFIYNESDFISLPRYAKYVFIEPMTVKAEDSLIRILSIDKLQKSIKADVEVAGETAFAPDVNTSTKPENTSDLPF